MVEIKNETEYRAMLARIDELLPLTWQEDTPEDSKENIELELISNLVADYEDIHYPIGKPSFVEMIKLRMYEWKITQKTVAEMLGISTSKMSEIMNGKVEPSLSLGKLMCQKLDMAPEIVLGL